MKLYDKRFVHFEWDEALEGKECIFGDNLQDIKTRLEKGMELASVAKQNPNNKELYPFMADTGWVYRFCYYDPHLKYKLAMERNEVVYWRENGAQPWRKVMSGHKWSVFLDYMVAYKELLTHRQLARWLARGNGEQIVLNDVDALDELITGDEWIYVVKDADKPVPDTVRVRRWEDEEWVKPTVDYCKEQER